MVSKEVDNSIDPEPTESNKIPFNTGVIVFKNNPKTLSVFESLLVEERVLQTFKMDFKIPRFF